MAHKAIDGSEHTNRSSMKRQNIRVEMDRKPKQEEEKPEDVVAQHGDAQEVTVKKQGDKFHVSSKHEDGHQHPSSYDSADEAHYAAGCLGGASEHQGHESPSGIQGL